MEGPQWHYPGAKLRIQVETGSQEPMLASTRLIVESDFEIRVRSFLPPKAWDSRCESPCSVYRILSFELRTLFMAGKRFTNRATRSLGPILLSANYKLPSPCNLTPS